MNERGYGVDWQDSHKYITYTDYWINVGMASTLDELKTVNPKFVDAKAVREKTVYNNNLRTDFVIKILHVA